MPPALLCMQQPPPTVLRPRPTNPGHTRPHPLPPLPLLLKQLLRSRTIRARMCKRHQQKVPLNKVLLNSRMEPKTEGRAQMKNAQWLARTGKSVRALMCRGMKMTPLTLETLEVIPPCIFCM